MIPLQQPALSAGEQHTPRQSPFGPADPLNICRPAVATSDLPHLQVIEPALPSTHSRDRRQQAQHDAHGHDQQPTSAAFHTKCSSPLPACRTGLDRVYPRPAGSYQHSRTGRYLLPGPFLRPQEAGPKRGFSQRVPMALTFGTRLSTYCLRRTIRHFQGTLPKAPVPFDSQPCGSKRPLAVTPGTARRQGRSPAYPMILNRSVSLSRSCTVIAPTGERFSDRLHQLRRCTTYAKRARPVAVTYVLHL
jgi:hypothetical protein